jgi:outer membrane protein
MRPFLFVTAAIPLIMCGSSLQGETLREALARTYSTNPTLAAQRELVEVSEEDIAIARAGGLPQVQSKVGTNHDLISSSVSGRSLSATVELAMPIFDGGRVSNRVRSAKALHGSQLATLREAEGDVLTEAVAAYVDVLQARAIAELHESQVAVLDKTLSATRRNHDAGDLTLTDIAQAEGRLALSRSDLAATRSRLRSAEENYRRIVGTRPEQLVQPQSLLPLPATADAAERIALSNSPALAAAVEEVRSAGYLVKSISAERLPLLSAVAVGRYVIVDGTGDRQFGQGAPDRNSAGGVGATASIPLFQGGSVSARVRQARARQRQLTERLSAVERQVIARTQAAFAAHQAAMEAIDANEIAVASNQTALEGSMVEFRVGTRILLDVLNAEQELLNSRVALFSAQRDAHVAAFTLLNAMGVATAEKLNLDGQVGALARTDRELSRVTLPSHEPYISTTDTAPTDSLQGARMFDPSPAATRPPEAGETTASKDVRQPIGTIDASVAKSQKAVSEIPTDPAGEQQAAPASREVETAVGQVLAAPALQDPAKHAPLKNGSFVVQLGSFRSATDARAGWQRLSGQLGLSALSPLIAVTTIRGEIFHRLSIGGFNSRAEALQACERMQAHGGVCFVRGTAGDKLLDDQNDEPV